MKKLIALAAAVVAGVAFATNWEITKEGNQAYISDGVWTFKAGLGGNRVKDIDGTTRKEGPYTLSVSECTVHPAAITPLDFSKEIENKTGDGRTYAISELATKMGTWSGYNANRVFTASDAAKVVGKLTLPTCDYQLTLNSEAFCKCEHIDFDFGDFPEGLVRINANAFAEADVYGAVDCQHLNYVGDYAFAKNSRLVDFKAPALTSIGSYTFWLSGVTNVNLGAESKLTGVGSYAFCECVNLVSFSPFLPQSCLKVGRGGFTGCLKLSSPLVYYGGNNSQDCTDSNDWEIFHNCQSLPSADLSHSTLKFLTRQSFDNCYALEWVKLPDTFVAFGKVSVGNQNGPFANCTNLTTVTPFIPDSVTNVQNSTFSNCPKLRGHLKMLGVIDVGGTSINGSGIDSVEFGPKLKSIGGSAFTGCKNLKEIKYPKKLRGVTVAVQAFKDCTSLEEADLRFVATFANQIFYNDAKLQTIRFGEGLTAIGNQPFFNAPGIREIFWYGDVPASLPSGLFQGCTKGAVTNYVPAAYKDSWQTVPGIDGSLSKTPIKWTSHTQTWIRTWNPNPGLLLLVK